MFYFLILLGIACVGLGWAYREREIKEVELGEDYKILESRISDIEKLIFDDFLEEQGVDLPRDDFMESEDLEEETAIEEKKVDEYMAKYNLLVKYEKEKKSMEEICQLLNMQKGEVYLLKNLYKDL